MQILQSLDQHCSAACCIIALKELNHEFEFSGIRDKQILNHVSASSRNTAPRLDYIQPATGYRLRPQNKKPFLLNLK